MTLGKGLYVPVCMSTTPSLWMRQSSLGEKCMTLGSNSLGTKSSSCHFITAKLWQGHLTSLNLYFPILGCWERVSRDKVYTKCSTHSKCKINGSCYYVCGINQWMLFSVNVGDLVAFDRHLPFPCAKYGTFSGFFLVPVCLDLSLHVSTRSSFPTPYSVDSFHSECQAVHLPVMVKWHSIRLTTTEATI